LPRHLFPAPDPAEEMKPEVAAAALRRQAESAGPLEEG